MIDIIRKIVPIAGLIILFVLFSVTTSGMFLKWNNLQSLILQSAITMVAAVGTAFVMAHNNLDFSLGGACAMSCVFAYLIVGNNLWLFFLMCIVIGVLCGLFSAVLHIKGKVPAFIAGLCLMFAGRGIAESVCSTQSMLLVQAAALNHIGFFIIVLVIVVAVGVLLFNFTKIGKYQKLIGTNPKAAELSGISVSKYKTIAFVLSGLTLGIAACLTVVRSPNIVSSIGTNLETNVLLALSLGGMSMTGGSSSKMRSAVIGTLIFYILNNGLTLWGLDANYVDIVKAAFFLFTVTISIDRSQYEVIV
ncbi:ABC transporter permease [Wansuia hejianensis]|uniref:Autoinducer 2 import system permease protein LsrD n=1 Tax=Wansuia hejianensis TaxID=2763667 RepID=A0A7G9G9G5_9FIRM|nr:ABC transporter permease [Wansuia hejianensis]QNM07447.1 ABC transporter permease [Wansuia hejianensis]